MKDFEEYFLMWNSVLFYPNPVNRNVVIHGYSGNAGTIPCHEHKTCKAKVAARSPFPPRVCPGCGADTLKEIQSQSEERKELWLPSSI